MTEQRRREEALGAVLRLRDAVQLAIVHQGHVNLRDLVPQLHDWRPMLDVLTIVERLSILERSKE